MAVSYLSSQNIIFCSIDSPSLSMFNVAIITPSRQSISCSEVKFIACNKRLTQQPWAVQSLLTPNKGVAPDQLLQGNL